MDRRSRCLACGICRGAYDHEIMCRLPVPDVESGRHLLADLYLESCASQALTQVCSSSRCGGISSEHVVQRRVCALPNVLLLQLCRDRVDKTMSRACVEIDADWALPGFGVMHLAAVIYHFGVASETGRYTCACRMADGGFCYFDNKNKKILTGCGEYILIINIVKGTPFPEKLPPKPCQCQLWTSHCQTPKKILFLMKS